MSSPQFKKFLASKTKAKGKGPAINAKQAAAVANFTKNKKAPVAEVESAAEDAMSGEEKD